MELEIVDKRDNPLLSRVEVRFKVLHDAASTPSRKEVREAVAKAVNAQKERVVVDILTAAFGKGETEGYAKVYKNKQEAMRVESESMKRRHGLTEPKKQEGEKKEGKEEEEAEGEKKE